MKITAADLKRMREQRVARINACKDEANNRPQEYLLLDKLPKGVKLWWPEGDTAQEVLYRITDFIVTKKDNIAGDEVGTFAGMRHIHVHHLPNKKSVICPRDYGHECPLCDAIHDHYEEVSKDQKHPLAKFKAKRITLCNALFKVAGADGRTKTVPRIIRGNTFFFMTAFNEALNRAEQFHPDKVNELYAYSDLELGYWITGEFGMQPAVAGNSKKFMQLMNCTLDWKNPSPVGEKAYPFIVDLDELIPPAPDSADLAKWLGDIAKPKPVVADTTEEADIDTDVDEIDCGIPGSAVEETIEAETVDAIPEETIEAEPEVEEEPKAPVKSKKVAKAEEKVAEPAKAEVADKKDDDRGEDFGDDIFNDADFGEDFDV